MSTARTIEAAAHRRSPGTLRVDAVPPMRIGEILATVPVRARSRVLAADLTLGSWRSHQVARDMAAQLGFEATPQQVPLGIDAASSYADFIGWAIDREAEGALDLHHSLCAARAVAAAATKTGTALVLILLPRFGLACERGDWAFVRDLLETATATARLRCLPDVPGD